jgi:hypothetical protein
MHFFVNYIRGAIPTWRPASGGWITARIDQTPSNVADFRFQMTDGRIIVLIVNSKQVGPLATV